MKSHAAGYNYFPKMSACPSRQVSSDLKINLSRTNGRVLKYSLKICYNITSEPWYSTVSQGPLDTPGLQLS